MIIRRLKPSEPQRLSATPLAQSQERSSRAPLVSANSGDELSGCAVEQHAHAIDAAYNRIRKQQNQQQEHHNRREATAEPEPAAVEVEVDPSALPNNNHSNERFAATPDAAQEPSALSGAGSSLQRSSSADVRLVLSLNSTEYNWFIMQYLCGLIGPSVWCFRTLTVAVARTPAAGASVAATAAARTRQWQRQSESESVELTARRPAAVPPEASRVGSAALIPGAVAAAAATAATAAADGDAAAGASLLIQRSGHRACEFDRTGAGGRVVRRRRRGRSGRRRRPDARAARGAATTTGAGAGARVEPLDALDRRARAPRQREQCARRQWRRSSERRGCTSERSHEREPERVLECGQLASVGAHRLGAQRRSVEAAAGGRLIDRAAAAPIRTPTRRHTFTCFVHCSLGT